MTFENCSSMLFLDIPASVGEFQESVFRWSTIKNLVVRGTFPSGLRTDTIYFMDNEATAYVQQSEIEKFKSLFPGTVLPLETYSSIVGNQKPKSVSNSSAYDLQGRRIDSPAARGVYIQNGRKVVK